MSAEHFETILSCDVRTAPDGRSVEYAERQTGHPRGLHGAGWVECSLYAHNVLEIVADAVRTTPMDGISGDMPAQREQAAKVIEAARLLVRGLACDAAHDGRCDQDWERLVAGVREAAA